jgi:aspartyl-tRNA(Asn)/glutamyl-tRNA(Gln) amidotransferase subunit C
MSLSNDDVKKIAHLARLSRPDTQIDDYAQRLSGILDMVAKLQEAPTAGIQPMAHPLDATQRLRPDAVTESNQRDAFQTIAPDTENGLYLVPKVIE